MSLKYAPVSVPRRRRQTGRGAREEVPDGVPEKTRWGAREDLGLGCVLGVWMGFQRLWHPIQSVAKPSHYARWYRGGLVFEAHGLFYHSGDQLDAVPEKWHSHRIKRRTSFLALSLLNPNLSALKPQP